MHEIEGVPLCNVWIKKAWNYTSNLHLSSWHGAQVKVKVKVKFTLEQATKAQRLSKLYSFFNLGAR